LWIPSRSPQFLPYQLDWILDDSLLKVYEKSRRIGITYATSYRRVRRALANKGLDAWVISRDEKTAKDFILYCAKWMRCANAIAQGLYSLDTVVSDPKHGVTSFVIKFFNGSRITALSSNPDAAAGKEGDFLIDELALHKDQAKLMDIALPATMWGYQVEIVSTCRARGVYNQHQKLVDECKACIKDNWSLHTTTIYDAVQQGLVEKINSVRNLDMSRNGFIRAEHDKMRSETAFQQEYNCNPIDTDAVLLPYSLIKTAQISTEEMQSLNAQGAVAYMGLDVARTGDLSVFCVLQVIGDVYYLSQVEVMKNADLDDHMGMARLLWKKYDPIAFHMDKTTMGAFLCDAMESEFGGRVFGVPFNSQPYRERLVVLIKEAFINRTLRIENDEELRDDLHSVQKRVSSKNYVTYSSPRTGSGHGDRFWSLSLALDAASGSPPITQCQPIDRESKFRSKPKHQNNKRPDHSGDNKTHRRLM